MGRPLPGYDVVLLDANGSPADEGEVSIRLDPRPVGLMDGYSGDPAEATAPAADIFYRTGDVAWRDSEGYLWYIGRGRRNKSSDTGFSPFKRESVAIENRRRRGGVVPSPDPCVSRSEVVVTLNRATRDAELAPTLRAPAPKAGP